MVVKLDPVVSNLMVLNLDFPPFLGAANQPDLISPNFYKLSPKIPSHFHFAQHVKSPPLSFVPPNQTSTDQLCKKGSKYLPLGIAVQSTCSLIKWKLKVGKREVLGDNTSVVSGQDSTNSYSEKNFQSQTSQSARMYEFSRCILIQEQSEANQSNGRDKGIYNNVN